MGFSTKYMAVVGGSSGSSGRSGDLLLARSDRYDQEPGGVERVDAAGGLDQLWDPVAPGERRLEPLDEGDQAAPGKPRLDLDIATALTFRPLGVV